MHFRIVPVSEKHTDVFENVTERAFSFLFIL